MLISFCLKYLNPGSGFKLVCSDCPEWAFVCALAVIMQLG